MFIYSRGTVDMEQHKSNAMIKTAWDDDASSLIEESINKYIN